MYVLLDLIFALMGKIFLKIDATNGRKYHNNDQQLPCFQQILSIVSHNPYCSQVEVELHSRYLLYMLHHKRSEHQ